MGRGFGYAGWSCTLQSFPEYQKERNATRVDRLGRPPGQETLARGSAVRVGFLVRFACQALDTFPSRNKHLIAEPVSTAVVYQTTRPRSSISLSSSDRGSAMTWSGLRPLPDRAGAFLSDAKGLKTIKGHQAATTGCEFYQLTDGIRRVTNAIAMRNKEDLA
jgi:hypothetical protein